MNDEKKPITEQIAETIKSVVDSTSAAAMQALKPAEPQKGGDVYVPEATDAAAAPPPLVPAKRKKSAQRATETRAIGKKAKKVAPKKTTKKAVKASVNKSRKAATKTSKKRPAKKSKARKAAGGKKKKGKR
jgi:hypothetical protein